MGSWKVLDFSVSNRVGTLCYKHLFNILIISSYGHCCSSCYFNALILLLQNEVFLRSRNYSKQDRYDVPTSP